MKLHKKFWQCVLAVVLLCVFALPETTQAASVSDLDFTTNATEDSYRVYGCNTNASGELEIPATYNGLPVTGIGRDAFRNCSKLTSVIIPDGVTDIDYWAFYNCMGITSITMPDSVNSIASCAFQGCTKLAEMVIPAGVTGLGDRVFYDCNSLTMVAIPNSVTSIGTGAFDGCYRLSTVIYCGTQAQWDAIEIGGSNAALSNATLQFHNYENSVCTFCQQRESVSTTVSVSTDKDTYYRGDTVTVTVSTSAVEHCVAGGFMFNFDTDVFAYVSGKALFSGYSAAGVSTANGKIAGYFMGGDHTIQGEIFRITLKVKDIAAVGDYTISGTAFMTSGIEEEETKISCTVENTQITVSCKHSNGSWTMSDRTQHKYSCSDCSYEEVENHQWDAGTVTQEPTCTEAGERTYACAVCGGSYAESISATDHDMRETAAAVAPTCENVGYTATLTCANGCGLEEGGQEIPAIFHSWDDGVITKEPSCKEPGIKIYTCANGCTRTEEVEKTTEHSYGQWFKANDTYNKRVCSVCENEETAYIDYTVMFLDWNGTVISSKTYHWGDKVTLPVNPTRAADNTWTYTFAGWDQTVVDCAGNASYTATYTSTYNDYTVTFKDADGKVLATKTYHWGDAITAPADPAKAADETYTYTFAGWDQDVVNCAGHAIYTATYDATYIEYAVKFLDADGTVLSTKNYHYDDEVTAPANPAKAADNTYTYTFAGWDKAVVNCAGEATYKATYNATFIEYTVVFKNWDGTVISTKNYHYGNKVTIPANPTRAADKTYTYTFAGWDQDVVNCAGNATYTATYDSAYIEYTVKFLGADGTVLSTKNYHYGETVAIPEAPAKAADKTYTYTFAGWDKAVVNCAGNATYTATYTSTYITYTVVFKNWDGTVISTKNYHYGNKVTVPANPNKAADKTYTYAFAGWDQDVVNCAGNATYTATYDSAYIEYTVKFLGADGTVLSTKTYHYGETVAVPEAPAKAADKTYTYTFAGWDKTVVNCEGDVTYTATYTSHYIDYTVTFQYADGTVIQQYKLHYGDAVAAPEDPAAQEAGAVFTGWDKAVAACTGNATYTAVFEKEEVPEIPGDVDGSREVTQDDVVYLLLHTMYGEESYPMDNAPADIDCNGTVDQDDAVYLLLHAMFGEMFYPLNTPALPVKIEE